jgi:hypothetical protein
MLIKAKHIGNARNLGKQGKTRHLVKAMEVMAPRQGKEMHLGKASHVGKVRLLGKSRHLGNSRDGS